MPVIRLAKCSGVYYTTKGAALDDIKLMHVQQKFRSKKNTKNSGRKVKPYLCNRCGLWHLIDSVNYRKILKRIKK